MRDHALWVTLSLFVVIYALWPFVGLPTPLYLPESGQILWQAPPGAIVMGWYGRVLGSMVVTAALAVALIPVVRRIPAEKRQVTTALAGLMTLGAMLLIGCIEWIDWIAGH